mmetsp:Transcript_22664/g.46629  ORF Transcript_22664/g.46629 Transcript_22664/m.46629 type:complete len:360 (+) Transcript_22664:1222-2301(+)
MHCFKVLGGLETTGKKDGGSSPRVVLQIGSAIIDVTLHNEPAAVLVVMLLNFLHADSCKPLLRGLHQLACLGGPNGRSLAGRTGTRSTHGVYLGALPHCSHWPQGSHASLPRCCLHCKAFIELPRLISHPAAWHGALSWMLEPHPAAFAVDLDAVNGVVQHAHHRPSELHRLAILIGIPSATANLFARTIQETAHVNLRLPPSPAPVLVSSACFCDLIFWPVELSDLPRLARIQGDLCSDDLVTSTSVTVSGDLDGFGQVLLFHKRVVTRLEHRRVDVHVVDDILRLVPPPLCISKIGINMGREHAVVEVMVMVLGRLVRDPHAREPFDHPATDATRQQRSQRKAMVRGKQLSILFEGQ